MSDTVAEIYAAAMALPSQERTELTRMLVDNARESLDLLYSQEWSEEIEKRLDAYHRGDFPGRTIEQVGESVRNALAGRRSV